MRTLIDEFNLAHEGQIVIEPTTLERGVPYYSKVQTSVAVGEGPDMMTYHTSRIPLAVENGTYDPITAEDLAAIGLGEASLPATLWDAAHFEGEQ